MEVPRVPSYDAAELEQQKKSVGSTLRWIVGIVSAIAAALGGWGATEAMRKQPVPAIQPPKVRTEELKLGADGKGGVWRRELFPWEK
jgi:hypothetical protein